MNKTTFIPNIFTENIITKLAQEETGKRQYYRPVYSLHKWWARRPGALFRAIILLAAKGRGSASVPALKRCEQLFQNIGMEQISRESEYFQSHDLSDIVIFDPFMGGGTTLVEANRMGAKVIGCDINPVSLRNRALNTRTTGIFYYFPDKRFPTVHPLRVGAHINLRTITRYSMRDKLSHLTFYSRQSKKFQNKLIEKRL